MKQTTSSSSNEGKPSRVAGRRLLLGGGLAAMATGAAWAPGRADAASGTSPWLLGGNDAVAANGTNYLGTQNAAPLIFKTAATAGTPTERMRITPTGLVGIGLGAPAAKLDVTQATGTAIRAQANGAATTNTAVQGSAKTGTGIIGQHTATTGSQPGILGETNSIDANAVGVMGRINATNSGATAGVHGVNNGTGASGVGVWGSHAGSGYGVYGSTANGVSIYGQGGPTGVYGVGFITGVFGESSLSVGVKGNTGQGIGVLGAATNGIAVEGQADTSQGGRAGRFLGNVEVQGTLTQSGGASVIDHPLEPSTKTLTHSFVESDEMKNVYDGVVTTDSQGRASVRLSRWFEALNKDLRYQLTTIGRAHAWIEAKADGGRFVIGTDQPGVEVCWQVTGVRQDAYANAHRLPVESDKPAAERGRYRHPELYGKGPEHAIGRVPDSSALA